MSRFSVAVSSSIWLSFEKVLAMALSLFVTLVVARYLSPDKFGQLNYLMSLAGLMAPIGALGLNALVTRELVRRPKDTESILGSSLLLRFLGAIAVGLIFFSMSGWLIDAGLIGAYIIVLFGTVFNSLLLFDFWLQASTENHISVKVRLTVLVVCSTLRLIAVWLELDLYWFVVIFSFELILTGLGFLLLYIVRQSRDKCFSVNKAEVFNLLGQSWWLLFSAVAATIYLKIDQVMLGKMIGNEEVGVYAVAARMSEVWYFFPTAVVISFFPKIIQIKKLNNDKYRILLQKLSDFLFLTSLIIAIFTVFLADWFMPILFGSEYAKSSEILKIHIGAGVFIFMRALLSKWLIAEDQLKFSLVTQVVGALINVILNYLLIPSFGGTGAAIATVVSYAFASYVSLFFHVNTWPMAKVMTNSILLPFRFLLLGKKMYSTVM